MSDMDDFFAFKNTGGGGSGGGGDFGCLGWVLAALVVLWFLNLLAKLFG